MTTEVIMQLALQFGLVPGLFVWLLVSNQKEHKFEREKSQEREVKLMEHISKSDETLTKIGETLAQIDKSMAFLQRDVEELKAK